MARSNYNPKPFGFDDFQNTYYERLFGAADNITLSFYNNRVPKASLHSVFFLFFLSTYRVLKASLHSIFFALTYTQILKAPVVSFFFPYKFPIVFSNFVHFIA